MKNFRRLLLKVYIHSMCLLALVCGGLYLATGLYDLACVIMPGQLLPDQVVVEHADNPAFIRAHYKSDLYRFLTEDQLTAQRLESLDQARRDLRMQGIRGIALSIGVIIVCAGVFTLHWRLRRRHDLVALAA